MSHLPRWNQENSCRKLTGILSANTRARASKLSIGEMEQEEILIFQGITEVSTLNIILRIIDWSSEMLLEAMIGTISILGKWKGADRGRNWKKWSLLTEVSCMLWTKELEHLQKKQTIKLNFRQSSRKKA